MKKLGVNKNLCLCSIEMFLGKSIALVDKISVENISIIIKNSFEYYFISWLNYKSGNKAIDKK